MFEFDKYEPLLHGLPLAAPHETYEPATNVESISLLFWAEHCVECAAPACYATCDLYAPRSDSRCRRSAFGAYRNRNFASFRGFGVEIVFDKWGQLIAHANTAQFPVRTVVRFEKILAAASPFADKVGGAVNRLIEDRRWKSLAWALTERAVTALSKLKKLRRPPDAFLLEVYNPNDRTLRFQLIFGNSNSPKKGATAAPERIPPIIKVLNMEPGYSRHVFAAGDLARVLRAPTPTITLIPDADIRARVVFLAADLVVFGRNEIARDGKSVKCVIWDLDNTVWNGTLAEHDEISLRPSVEQAIKTLDARGILQSIASKNDFESAWGKLRELNIDDYFLCPQIDWRPKSRQINAIAEQLNLDPDSFAVLDDSPFERAEVKGALPEVLCIDAGDVADLIRHPRFQGSSTSEAVQRRQLYRQQFQRAHTESEFGLDYLNFLASCHLILDIGEYSPDQRERVVELVQRTNQLNFSGQKYTRAELDELLADPTLGKLVLRCSDKYGSYGTVGFCLMRPDDDAVKIVDFMLSCRVQGKFIEKTLFGHLMNHHNLGKTQNLCVRFKRSERNAPALKVLRDLGFAELAEANHGELSVKWAQSFGTDVIEVRCGALRPGQHSPLGSDSAGIS